MKYRFLLYCDLMGSFFTLTKEGEKWKRQFADLSEALSYAGSIIEEPTAVVFYNQQGQAVTESMVKPQNKKG